MSFLWKPISKLFNFLLIVICLPNCLPARNIPDGVKAKDEIGISELKRYFDRSGYLPAPKPGLNFTDAFDHEFESAVSAYRTRKGLQVTRRLDSNIVSSLVSRKDGLPSSAHTKLFHETRRYTFFNGTPRWERPNPMILSYGFSPLHMIDRLSLDDIRSAFAGAFARWAQVIPVQFEETSTYDTADVRVGFYWGDHGDGEPFDGVLGVLGHSFSPEDGRLHLDGVETWSVDFKIELGSKAVDLESVATHEIGHILGLGHSSNKDAVMYPVLKPRTTKVDLALDDVEGIQALYGSNPNFTFNSLSRQSESASNLAVGRLSRVPVELTVAISALVLAFLGLPRR